jgi:arabinogalactan oligomer/maltooligosaccharide transport system substrate-binding protein
MKHMSRFKSINVLVGIVMAVSMAIGTGAVATYASAGHSAAVHNSCNLKIWDFFPSNQNDNERSAMLKLANDWENSKSGGGCTVTEPIQPSAGYETSFISSPKTAGDVIMLPDDQEGVVWGDHLIAPTTLNKKNYLPDALGGAINGGKTYAYPMFLETMMIYYNPSLIKSSTFSGKYTWNTIANAAKTCVNDSKCTYGMGWQWDNVYDDAQFLQSLPGSGYFAKTSSGFNPNKILLDSKATISGLNYLQTIMKDAGWTIGSSGSATDFLAANGGDGTATSLFEGGKLGILDIGPWADGEFKQLNPAFTDYKVAAPPALKIGKKTYTGTPFVGVQDLVVNKFSPNLKQAQKLASYLSLHVGQQLYTAGGRLPAAKAAFNSLTNTPELSAYKKALGHVIAMPNIPQMGDVWGPTQSELTLFMEGKLTAAAAMKASATAIKKAEKTK